MRWKNNALVSLELRDGSFVLIQLLNRTGWVAVFNLYTDDNNWKVMTLSLEEVLFITCTTKSFRQRSKLASVKHIDPIPDLTAPSGIVSRLNTEPGFRNIVLWPNTGDEMALLVDGEEDSVGLHVSGRSDDGLVVDTFTPIRPSDYGKYRNIETSHLSDYPLFNERLLLCKSRGWNFDPMRSLYFNEELDLDCKVYASILSGKVEISNLGY